MDRPLLASLSLTVFAVATLAAAAPAPAASGLAYGAVTKFSIGSADGPAPAPGSFRTDYDTAASPSSGGSSPHVPFGLGKMIAKAQAAVASLKNGTAEKHYVGTNKERVDNVALQSADITNCLSRTITHLDLAKKTYSVESLDHPEATAPPETSHREAAPRPAATDDGTKYRFDITTRALGAMTIEGVPTTGYDTNITMTAIKPSGETSTANMAMTAYYAALEEPHFGCSERAAAMGAGASPSSAAAMANFALALRALRTPRGDARFTVTASGPAVPGDKFAMWQEMTMAGNDKHDRGGFGVITERGDVRSPLSDSDGIFNVPPDFTKVDG